MAFFHGDIYSYALDKMTPLNVYLPCDDNRRFLVDRPQKTLILLHGLEGNSSYWGRYTVFEHAVWTELCILHRGRASGNFKKYV